MPTYTVYWTEDRVAQVEADSPEDAREAVDRLDVRDPHSEPLEGSRHAYEVKDRDTGEYLASEVEDKLPDFEDD